MCERVAGPAKGSCYFDQADEGVFGVVVGIGTPRHATLDMGAKGAGPTQFLAGQGVRIAGCKGKGARREGAKQGHLSDRTKGEDLLELTGSVEGQAEGACCRSPVTHRVEIVAEERDFAGKFISWARYPQPG